MDQVTTIRLYGSLGRKFGRVHHLAVSNAAEAVRALGVLYAEFDAWLTAAKDRGEGYAVFYGDNNLKEQELHLPALGKDIRIAPVILGSKSGGWFNIILGAVLIVVGSVLTAYGFGAIGAPLIGMGWGMVVGGVAQLLTPTPKGMSSKDRPENIPSYNFNGPINTQAQGNPVPLLYGELIVGSAVISAGISVEDEQYIPQAPGTGPGYGGGGGGGAPGWYTQAF